MHSAGPYRLKSADITPDNCDTEPIHIPGCVQPHGVLLVLRKEDFVVLQISENSAEWLGKIPEELVGHGVDTIIGGVNLNCLKSVLDQDSIENNPRYVFSFSPVRPSGSNDVKWLLDVTAHISGTVLVLEMERTTRTDGNATDYYSLVKQPVARLQRATTLRGFCQTVTEDVAKLTGLDRVMVYRFAEDESGWVVAETKRDWMESFLDLHYPATDVPKPAREIYKKIWLRPLPDAHAQQCELTPLVNPDTGEPLDMTYCFLRGASKMYTDYLRNMKVRMSLTMAIQRDGKLWGLIACHHNEPKIITYEVRAACEFLAQVVSLQMKSAEEREESAYKDRIQTGYESLLAQALLNNADVSTFNANPPNLLDFIPGGGASVESVENTWFSGKTPSDSQRRELVIWLRDHQKANSSEGQIYATHKLSKCYPPALAFAEVACGLLAVPISRTGSDWLLWFRPEVAHTVSWAGDPNDKPIVTGPHGPRLMPRTSFEIWKETVRGQSEPWRPVEIEAAGKLKLAMLEVVSCQAERLANLNRQLEASNEELDSFAYVASHDLKEPLRGIFHYAQHLIDNCSDKVDENSKMKLHSLLRLTQRMDALINSLLHYSRLGRLDLTMTEVDLNEPLDETLELLVISRQEAKVEIRKPRPLPIIKCDEVRVRELLMNLISNSLKYNDKAQRWIEVGYANSTETGECVFYIKDNGIGIQKHLNDQVFKMFRRLHGRDEFGGGTGVGLTICQKIVERHGGRIWLDSIPGGGSTFYFTLARGGSSA